VLASLGFLAFRVVDIFKPWPIRRLERLPAGWGVLADDLVAGLIAATFVLIAMRLLIAV
jgi:phosphatidylglycerophosphatase A